MTATILSISLRRPVLTAIAVSLGLGLAPQITVAEPMHAIAMHGDPALPADYDHFPYANAEAPKGGRIAFGGQGTFDNLNPFIAKGAVPDGLWARNAFWSNNLWDSLMVRNWDEPFTMYGHVAQFVEVPDDRSWVEFTLNPAARFSDGEPITTADVVFTFDLLREKGRPSSVYKSVSDVEEKPGGKVRFTFSGEPNREAPLIMAIMPVLPKHAVDPETFDQTTFDPPPGSGPYLLDKVNRGTSFTLKRNPDYWARDLPQKRGFDNFDEVRVEYIRDGTALFEAFKTGVFSVTQVTDPALWRTGFTFPAIQNGDVVTEEVPTGVPDGMNGFVYNTRHQPFDDVRVRKALTYFFDFDWANAKLFNGAYARTGSFFEGSELSSLGRPASEKERALLAPFPDAVEADVMDGTYAPPKSDGTGNDRASMRAGIELLKEAGFKLEGNDMIDPATGKPFAFEFLALNKEQETVAQVLQGTLTRVGIHMSIRSVDSAQYWERILPPDRDYDMMQWTYGSSLSPGTEQVNRWTVDQGNLNFAGVQNPAVTAMVEALLAAKSYEDFVTAARALDRVLISGHYVLPLFHAENQWIAHWTNITGPKPSLYGMVPSAWWSTEVE